MNMNTTEPVITIGEELEHRNQESRFQNEMIALYTLLLLLFAGSCFYLIFRAIFNQRRGRGDKTPLTASETLTPS
ncbi:hypothetical protein WR25_09914 [Diploscapter pachys]|uniref:Uncharacterized protein n=1 Tax=Diploscapter pachys TaxID=2018661 RepID=A0A2A2JYF7_9BILA|nr:hypothetical protein WR25_09914 [Diploscapter pachys]